MVPGLLSCLVLLTFWLTPFLRSAFVNYVKKNGGSVDKLIVALKR